MIDVQTDLTYGIFIFVSSKIISIDYFWSKIQLKLLDLLVAMTLF